MGVSEPSTKEEVAQFLKPKPWCLAKTIQDLIEFAHIRRSLSINESLRLLNVDILRKGVIGISEGWLRPSTPLVFVVGTWVNAL